MTGTTSAHPVLGPGFTGARAWLWVLGMCGMAFLVGLLMNYFNPLMFVVALLAMCCLTGFVYFSVTYPLAMLCVVVACQILMPVYIRLPGGIPPPLFLLAGLISVVAAKKMLRPVPAPPGRYEHLIAIALIAYNAALLISIPGEHASMASYLMLIKTGVIPTALFFIFVATVRTPEHLGRVFITIIIAGFLCGILGLHEFITGQNVLALFFSPQVTYEEDFFLWMLANPEEAQAYTEGSIYRVYSFFTQPLEYSTFMIMAFPFAFLSFVAARKLGMKLLFGVATLINFAGFIVSFSRGPTLALALTILFMGIFERRVRVWIWLGAAGLMAGIVAYWPLIVEKIGERVTGSENITLRFSLWQNGLEIFLQNPLRGIGFGSYPGYHVESIRANQIGPMYEYTWAHIERVTTVENIYISLAAETGLIGLAAFGFLIAVTLMVFLRLHRHLTDDLSRRMNLASGAAILAYLLSGMTVANIIGYTISILFLGVYCAALAVLSRELPKGQLARPLAQDRQGLIQVGSRA